MAHVIRNAVAQAKRLVSGAPLLPGALNVVIGMASFIHEDVVS